MYAAAVIVTRAPLTWVGLCAYGLLLSPLFFVVLLFVVDGLRLPKAVRYFFLSIPVVTLVVSCAFLSPQLFVTALVVCPAMTWALLWIIRKRREGSAAWWRLRRRRLREKRRPFTEKTKRILGTLNRPTKRDPRGRFLRPMREAKAKVWFSRLIIYD